MSSQLSQLRESMEAEHAVALEQLTQRLQDSKQQSVDALAEQHSAQITELNSEIGSLKSQVSCPLMLMVYLSTCWYNAQYTCMLVVILS